MIVVEGHAALTVPQDSKILGFGCDPAGAYADVGFTGKTSQVTRRLIVAGLGDCVDYRYRQCYGSYTDLEGHTKYVFEGGRVGV